jgi:hypothetical protein
MLFHADDLALAHAAQRRKQLLDEADAYRQVRAAKRQARAAKREQPPYPGGLARPTRADRFYRAAGSLLVRWGTQLQGRSRTAIAASAAADTLVESRGA